MHADHYDSEGADAAERQVLVTTVNGQEHRGVVDVRTTLADYLRHNLGLVGTHLGCEHGVCGACTVLVGGTAIRSCLMLAVQADGAQVETVEGLASDGELTPLQEAFHRNHALQCGYCTSGFLMSVTEALREGPVETEQSAREVLSGNICRCTGYAGMIKAVLEASAQEHPASNPGAAAPPGEGRPPVEAGQPGQAGQHAETAAPGPAAQPVKAGS
jgi:aerobic-type carbon monoxide dehydrogenase small subunit (CoxS/CutS family)